MSSWSELHHGLNIRWMTPTQAILFLLSSVLVYQLLAYQRRETPPLAPADTLWNLLVLVRDKGSPITESRQHILALLKQLPPAILRELAMVSVKKLDTTDPECWEWVVLLARARAEQQVPVASGRHQEE